MLKLAKQVNCCRQGTLWSHSPSRESSITGGTPSGAIPRAHLTTTLDCPAQPWTDALQVTGRPTMRLSDKGAGTGLGMLDMGLAA
ncbi:hypothetical protein QFZ67_000848 [Streptomyces sp. V1I1]|nr:hypothetical protein [Streptomyces sp. V1I1]